MFKYLKQGYENNCVPINKFTTGLNDGWNSMENDSNSNKSIKKLIV